MTRYRKAGALLFALGLVAAACGDDDDDDAAPAATDEPATEAPATEAPATEAPATEAPETNAALPWTRPMKPPPTIPTRSLRALVDTLKDAM